MVTSRSESQPSPSEQGRVFRGLRRCRLGDVTSAGRLRLDALARYAQDVSDDDTTDAGLGDELGWVVRRTMIDVVASARLAEDLTFTTFCSGLGRRWAERRLRVVGSDGAHYEIATLWIGVDLETGRPRTLTDRFLAIYETAAAGRKVSARLILPKPPATVEATHWPLRAVDFDVFDHVNNAAYWAAVEERLAVEPEPEPYRALIEYGAGIALDANVSVGSAREGATRSYWWLVDSSASELGEPVASASLQPLAPSLYQP